MSVYNLGVKGFEYYERKEVNKCWGEPQNSDCRRGKLEGSSEVDTNRT